MVLRCYVSKIDKKGRIQIPQYILDEIGIKAGQKLVINEIEKSSNGKRLREIKFEVSDYGREK